MHVSVVNAGVSNYRVGFCRQISIVRIYVNISVFKDGYTIVSRGRFKIPQIWGDIAIIQSVKFCRSHRRARYVGETPAYVQLDSILNLPIFSIIFNSSCEYGDLSKRSVSVILECFPFAWIILPRPR